jgi:hypothetical protein
MGNQQLMSDHSELVSESQIVIRKSYFLTPACRLGKDNLELHR